MTIQSPGWKPWKGLRAWRWESSINLLGDKGESFRLLQYSNMSFSPRAVEGRGLCAGGQRISKELHSCALSHAHVGEHYWERLCPWQVCVPTAFLASFNFRMPFSLSTTPPLAGWYAVFPQISVPDIHQLAVLLTKRDPLSRLILVGIPHVGII